MCFVLLFCHNDMRDHFLLLFRHLNQKEIGFIHFASSASLKTYLYDFVFILFFHKITEITFRNLQSYQRYRMT